MVKVVKFGGSSSAEQFTKVGDIIRSDESRKYVVPSAPGKRNSKDTKVTDMLYACYDLAENDQDFKVMLRKIKDRYDSIINGLHLKLALDEEFKIIAENFKAKAGVDYAASRGEYLNGIIMANNRITINTKTTTAPPVAILLAIFLHFFSFCTLGSKKCSKCFSKNFIIGLMRYAITSPKVIGCNTFIMVSQPFETPLYRYIIKKNIVQQQNSTNTSTARLMYQRIPCSVFPLFFLSSSIPFSFFFRNFISGYS
jgi:hypothetical protein